MKSIRTLFFAAAFLAVALPQRALPASGYYFTTLAGNPSVRYSFANGANSQALFNGPSGVAADSLGNLFIADQLNYVIREARHIGTNWMVTTIAGSPGQYNFAPPIVNGTNSHALFNFPTGVAVDAFDNVYVADQYNYAIRKITPQDRTTNWVVTTLAGTGNFGSADGAANTATFGGPTGVAVDIYSNIFVADQNNYTIRMISPVPGTTNWIVTTIAGTAGSQGSTDAVGSNARFNYPAGVAVDVNDNVYVADEYNNAIRMISRVPGTTNWSVHTIAGNPLKSGAADGTNSSAEFDAPSGVCVDTNGNLFVADQENFTIRKIVPIGTNWVVSTIGGKADVTGSNNGMGTNASFYYPFGIAADTYGNLFVADTDNNTIRLGDIPNNPQMTQLVASPQNFQFLLTGQPGGTCVIQTSYDLLNWSPWLTNTIPTTGSVIITDPAPVVNPFRFYRAILP